MRQKIFAIVAMAALATAFVTDKAMAGYYGGHYGGGYYGGWRQGGYGWGWRAPYSGYGYGYPIYGYVVGYAVPYTYAYPAYVTYAPAYGCGCGGWGW